MSHRIALDAMGGDYGPAIVVPAAIRFLAENASERLILVGDEAVLARQLASEGHRPSDRLTIRHATQRVEMDDAISIALRTKKDSSMRVAINLVKSGEADACVSAGNTGALMATARFLLKTLPGVDRPAICSPVPSDGGHTYLLDLGANVDCSPMQLFQFGIMGAVLAGAVDDNPKPKVGLLNVGEEEIKGSESVKEAARLLSEADVHYLGFVEGNDIYLGTTDVVVCDGFVGNVGLKASEGVAKMLAHFLKQEFNRNLMTRLTALAVRPALRRFRARIDPGRYNGASLLGLRGIVIKSHGNASVFAYVNAIKGAVAECEKNVPALIGARIESILGGGARE